jgi:2'-5' RNA ligase
MTTRRPRRKFGPSRNERIFFACLPDAETCARIHALALSLKEKHGFSANLILPEHLHVTLFHLGDWHAMPEDVIRLAKDAAGEAHVAPFDVTFKRAESFRNRTGVYPFVLTGDAAQWSALHAALGAALKKAGLGAATQGEFLPHITLTYDEVRVKPAPVEPVQWTVRDFVLVHSRLGKTTHHHLARWSLGSG